jgi:activator of HSP90 ATPase
MPMHPRTTTIRQRVTLPAAPAAVYEAITNARRHSAFTGARASGAARAGARFTAWDGYIQGRHLALEKARRILQEWTTAEWPQGCGPSRLDLRLAARGRHTVLTMVQSGVPARQAARLRDGWHEHYWKPLKAYLAMRAA